MLAIDLDAGVILGPEKSETAAQTSSRSITRRTSAARSVRILLATMGTENDDFRPAHVYQSESRAITRRESAMTQRTMDDMATSLVAIQRHLLNLPVSGMTVNQVAQELVLHV